MVEGTDRIAEVLDAVIAHVERCDVVGRRARRLQPVTEALGIKFRKAAPAVYAAVEGVHRGLPLFDSMYLLGRERTLDRLRARPRPTAPELRTGGYPSASLAGPSGVV